MGSYINLMVLVFFYDKWNVILFDGTALVRWGLVILSPQNWRIAFFSMWQKWCPNGATSGLSNSVQTSTSKKSLPVSVLVIFS